MLIIMYLFTVNFFMPRLGQLGLSLIDPSMKIIITVTGMMLLMGAVGFKVSTNLGSTIMGGIFIAIGYLVRTLVNAIGWIVRSTFRMVPHVYYGSKRTFTQIGLTNAVANNLLSALTVLLFLAIII